MRRALKRARDGVALDVAEAAVLLQARGDDLTDLAASAARVRDAGLEAAGRPGVITYSRKVFIPLTRLCRDKCHYCTFVTVPGKLRRAGHGMFLSPDEVLDIARQGAEMGCKEALFTLGDRPEDRWPEAREWLEAEGYDDTLAYVRAMAIRVLEETGLLPHLNPGVHDLDRPPAAQARRAVHGHDAGDDGDPPVVRARRPAPRLAGQGARRTAAGAGGRGPVQRPVHHRHPDRHRRVVRGARRLALRAAPDRPRLPRHPGSHRPELPRQAGHGDARHAGRRAGGAGRGHRGRPPHPRPVRPHPGPAEPGRRRVRAADRRRHRRLGRGVTADPRPCEPRAPLAAHRRTGREDRRGRASSCANGSRSTRSSSSAASPGSTRACCRTYGRSPTRRPGSRDEGASPAGLPWQEPDEGFTATGRTDLHRTIDTEGRTCDRRDDFDDVYGDWEALREAAAPGMVPAAHRHRRASRRSRRPPTTRRSSPTTRRSPCCTRTARRSTRCAGSPTTLRRDVVGDDVTYIVTRNINFTNVCYTGCRFCAFAQRRTDADAYTLSLDQVADRAEQAWDVGAVEVCMQGGIHPDLPGTAYFDIARAVKERVPGMHVHAFSPMEVVNGATRTGHVDPRLADRGEGGRTRLDPRHGRRDPRRRGPLGPHQGQAAHGDLDRGRQDRPRAGHPLRRPR